MIRRHYCLRPVRTDERDLIFHWRNEPAVRAVMPRRAPIDRDYHARWWPQALAEPRRRMMILDEGPTPVAIIVFLDLERGSSSSWGYYTAPHSDISRPCARAAWIACEFLGISYAFRHLHLETLVCEVMQSNVGVIRLHRLVGFEEVGVNPSGDERPSFSALRLKRERWNADWAGSFFSSTASLLVCPDPRDGAGCEEVHI